MTSALAALLAYPKLVLQSKISSSDPILLSGSPLRKNASAYGSRVLKFESACSHPIVKVIT